VLGYGEAQGLRIARRVSQLSMGSKKKKRNWAKARSQLCKLGQGQGRELQTEATTRAKARREDQGVNLGHRRVKEVEN